MASTTADTQLNQLADEISKAFQGGAGPTKDFLGGADKAVDFDATKFAASMLTAYESAALVNPTKAIKTKGIVPPLSISNPENITQKAWWNDIFRVIETVAPVVINALSKDFNPQQPTLREIIDKLPPERKNDKAWSDYATQLLVYGGHSTLQCMAGVSRNQLPDPPQAPPGMPKGWFDDVCKFVADAAPVALPIIMSLL